MTYLSRKLSYFLLQIILLSSLITNAQQFAGTSASNNNQVVHEEDIFRDFKNEDLASGYRQNVLKRKLLGYSKSQWGVGVLADGDFSRALSDKSVPLSTGHLGINAIKTATLFQLNRDTTVSSRNIYSLFQIHKRQVLSYDSLRGDMNWQAFSDTVRTRARRFIAFQGIQNKYIANIKLLKLTEDSLKNAIAGKANIDVMVVYNRKLENNHDMRAIAFTKSKQALDAYNVKYEHFRAALEKQYFVSKNTLQKAVKYDDWLNGEFPVQSIILKESKTIHIDSVNYKILVLKIQRAENRHLYAPDLYSNLKLLKNKMRPILFMERFQILENTFGVNYLDTLRILWPNVRATYTSLAQQVSDNKVDILKGLLTENQNLIKNKQADLDYMNQRMSVLKSTVHLSYLPFNKLRYRNKIEFNVIISLGNASDSLRSVITKGNKPIIANRSIFGSNLLVPGSAVQAGRAISMNLLITPFTPIRPQLASLGVHGYLNYSSSRWSSKDTTYQVGVFSLSAGLQYTVFDIQATLDAAGHREGNNISIAFQSDIVYRNIGGEIGRSMHSNAREVFLGTSRRDYIGYQPSFVASIDNFRVTFSYPIFPGQIPGFSGGYSVIGFGFSGSLQAGRSRVSGVKPWRNLIFK